MDERRFRQDGMYYGAVLRQLAVCGYQVDLSSLIIPIVCLAARVHTGFKRLGTY